MESHRRAGGGAQLQEGVPPSVDAAKLRQLAEAMVRRGHTALDDNLLALQFCGGDMAAAEVALRDGAFVAGLASASEPEPEPEHAPTMIGGEGPVALECSLCDAVHMLREMQYCHRCTVNNGMVPAWICVACRSMHAQVNRRAKPAHELTAEPPPPPFWERLNRGENSEDSIFLKIDHDSQGSRVSIPPATLRRQMSRASDHVVPVVCLAGPTGTGKSFLASSFVACEGGSASLPAVALADQTQATSSHVRFFRCRMPATAAAGTARTDLLGTTCERNMIVLDLEGEDGNAPRTLVGHHVGKSSKAGEHFRRRATKTTVPSLAYQLSDLVIYMDTVELRRKEKYVERIRDLGAAACSMSIGTGQPVLQKPALVVIQNKWDPTMGSDSVDQTIHYRQVVAAGADYFSDVTVMRMPTTAHTRVLEQALDLVRERVGHVARTLSRRASCTGARNEREWWLSAHQSVQSVQLHHDRYRQIAERERARQVQERRWAEQAEQRSRRWQEDAKAAAAAPAAAAVDDDSCTIL
eukprot:COSAG06_NODE_3543_length_5206_cov_3.184257_2_plen_525_part_00